MLMRYNLTILRLHAFYFFFMAIARGTILGKTRLAFHTQQVTQVHVAPTAKS